MPGIANEPPTNDDHEKRTNRRKTPPDIRAQRAAELEALVADITARIRPACPHLSDAEFEELARDMARMELRFRDMDKRLNP